MCKKHLNALKISKYVAKNESAFCLLLRGLLRVRNILPAYFLFLKCVDCELKEYSMISQKSKWLSKIHV